MYPYTYPTSHDEKKDAIDNVNRSWSIKKWLFRKILRSG
nr:MAG TPA: hypothetical protein [Caudoviricetes sp.]